MQAAEIKTRMLNWATQFSILVYLDSNNYRHAEGDYECLLAVKDATVGPIGGSADTLESLQQLHDSHKDWVFGHINYDYKNIIEPTLSSRHKFQTGFPLAHFFIPDTVCYILRDQLSIVIETFGDADEVFKAILGIAAVQPTSLPKLDFVSVAAKQRYLDTVHKLRNHIREGDCYEINFCNQVYCSGVELEPLAAFNSLNRLSPAPFAAFYRLMDSYLICASPERYLRKAGDTIMAQPIKGTARRSEQPLADEQMRMDLRNDEKERAENVMIVDLLRNDLARSCTVGSVVVNELFGIYTFPQVHQMISTISGKLSPGSVFTDAIRRSFPMGSMTGAPKYKVMQLTEQYEQSARELYSGAVGYITPAGDFDFNVVIRSLIYNAATQYLCYHTGGAITYDSIPEKEWEETRLKAWAMERLFQ